MREWNQVSLTVVWRVPGQEDLSLEQFVNQIKLEGLGEKTRTLATEGNGPSPEVDPM